MAKSTAGQQLEQPAFINYLMDPDQDHDCYFLVGNKDLVTPEKIGAVKKMLLAHSVVLRTELQESKMAEKGVVSIKDLYPDTFRNLLRYVYGYDNTESLSFDEADNLVYAAEKYLMTALKNKLATRLIKLLTYENICTLMNNPACFKHLELDSAITKILQYETSNVLASPQFPSLNLDGFMKILEQDILNVSEVEVWRAALKWAKNRTASEDGEVLRKELTPCMKLIRFCTISGDDLCKEIICTNVLSDLECLQICKSIGTRKEQDQLTEICNTLKCRTKPQHSGNSDLYENLHCYHGSFTEKEVDFMLLTKGGSIELLPFALQANKHPQALAPKGLTYQCDCTVKITRITDYINNTSTEPPLTVKFTEPVEYGRYFLMPITVNGDPVRLLSNNKYNIKVTFSQPHHLPKRQSEKCYCDHMTLGFMKQDQGLFVSPIYRIKYRILPK